MFAVDFMDEMERRFAGALVLSERESKGLRIGGTAARSVIKQDYTLVCKVLSVKPFRHRSFIDLFSRLWGVIKGLF